jgi:nucleotide-binding universal stress UspA family protein
MLASVTGQSASLIAYEQVRDQLKFRGSADRGIREIPVHAIVGSVGRYQDFTRSFLPTNPSDEARWANVKTFMEDEGAPPIEVYQVGDAYFVLDGNHRVSIARQTGLEYLPAHVTEITTRVPFSHHDLPEQVVCKARYAEFLEQSRLDELRPDSNLFMTLCDQYDLLLSQIEVHRYFLFMEHQEELPAHQVVSDWYDTLYLPVVQMIREQGILLDFPERTEADLYILVTEHRLDLEKRLGWEIDTSHAAANYAQSKEPGVGERLLGAVLPGALRSGPAAGQWRKQRLAKKDQPALFIDILVALLELPAGWNAVDHAILVAQREVARLRGLQVSAGPPATGHQPGEDERREFERRCRLAGVRMDFTAEPGPPAIRIPQRAAWVDLLVLPLPPPGTPPAEAGQAGVFDQVLHTSARPILAIPSGANSPLDRAVLAYDASPKADEALYAAAYLALRWELELVVVSAGSKPSADETLHKARAYLNGYLVEAEYVSRPDSPAQAILDTTADRAANLIIIGGHGQRPLMHRLLGSTVHDVVGQSRVPLLICC